MRTALATLLIAAAALPAAPLPAGLKNPDDLPWFAGRWTAVEMNVNGEAQAQVPAMTWSFTADGRGTTPFGRKPHDVTITLDKTTNPKSLRWVAAAGTVWQCAYEFDGDDRLRLCFVEAKAKLPAKVAPAQGATYYVWVRKKE